MSRLWWVILLLLGATSVVAFFPAASPPTDLSWSRGPFTDEGLKTYNAKNFVLTGHWKLNEQDSYPGWHLRSPLFTALVVTSFQLNGVGLVQARLVGIFFGLLLPPVLCLLCWRNGQRAQGLIAWALLTTTYLYLMYARLCLFDIALATFLTLCLCGLTWGWSDDRSHGTHWAVQITLALLAFIYAFLIKPVVVVMLPTVLISLAMSMRRRRIPLRRLLIPVGVVLSGVILFSLVALLCWDNATTYVTNRLTLNLASTFAGIFIDFDNAGHVLGPAEFWRQTPTLTTLAFCGLLVTLRRWRTATPLDRLTLLWLANYLLFLAFINYKPNRYFLPLLPPMAILAANFIVQTWNALPAVLPRKLALAPICLFLVLHLLLGASQYTHWATQRNSNLLTAAESLNQLIPTPTATIAGTWATPLALDTRFRAFPTGEGANRTPAQFQAHHPDYAIVEKPATTPPEGIGHDYLTRFPDLLDRVDPIHTFRVGRYELVLLRLTWKPDRPIAQAQ